MKAITAKEIRDRLGEYLDRAHLSGEVFVVTRKGRGKAVLVGAAEYLEMIELLDAAGKKVPPSPTSKRGEQHITKDQLRNLIQ
jgi:prevent-host-death family protein